MNISKNLLSLGLIAVISGISTAQTYTATAGTNGVTDIQSDYSMSTGDGASVSVDVPLEFELPKKIALAVSPTGTNTLPVNPLFDGITPLYQSKSSTVISMTPMTQWANHLAVSESWTSSVGGIYANTSITVEADATPLVHESDSSSLIQIRKGFYIGQKDGTGSFGGLFDDASDSSATSLFPASVTLDDSDLLISENKFSFLFSEMVYLDTIDPTDRAGKYTSIATIIVTAL